MSSLRSFLLCMLMNPRVNWMSQTLTLMAGVILGILELDGLCDIFEAVIFSEQDAHEPMKGSERSLLI